jgi:tellurite resistance protein
MSMEALKNSRKTAEAVVQVAVVVLDAARCDRAGADERAERQPP